LELSIYHCARKREREREREREEGDSKRPPIQVCTSGSAEVDNREAPRNEILVRYLKPYLVLEAHSGES